MVRTARRLRHPQGLAAAGGDVADAGGDVERAAERDAGIITDVVATEDCVGEACVGEACVGEDDHAAFANA